MIKKSMCAITLCVLGGCHGSNRPAVSSHPLVSTPAPVAQTAPVPHDRDAADDPAIWVNPTHPEESLIIGTDKKGGLLTYALDGTQRQLISDGSHPNNVDVLERFELNGKVVELAVAGCRVRNADKEPAGGLKFWAIDRGTGVLSDVTAGEYQRTFVHDGEFGEPYGSTVFRSPKSNKPYVFVNDKDGQVEQYEIVATANGSEVGCKRVRSFKLKTQVEGCVCDDARGVIYIAEETVGIWRFDAEPDGSSAGHLIARVGENGLVADVEGLTLYEGASGGGYLIASSQGSNTFKVYDRKGDNAYIATIDPVAGASQNPPIGDIEETDGIVATSANLGARFPVGILVVQDGKNEPDHQNFKVYRWSDVVRWR